jgi:hypothetical protein
MYYYTKYMEVIVTSLAVVLAGVLEGPDLFSSASGSTVL